MSADGEKLERPRGALPGAVSRGVPTGPGAVSAYFLGGGAVLVKEGRTDSFAM